MYVRVQIHSRSEDTGLLIPVSAILRDDENLPFVYVAQSDGSFARRHVTLGYRDGDRYEIPAGLQAGDSGRRRRHLRSIHAKPMSAQLPPNRTGAAPASVINRIVACARQRSWSSC